MQKQASQNKMVSKNTHNPTKVSCIYMLWAPTSKFVRESMATYLQNKISSDIAADNCSLDSLSFAGYLSIQDQQSTLSPPNRDNGSNKDKQFEFSTATPHTIAHKLNKKTPADTKFSRSQLLPQASLHQLKQSRETNKHDHKKIPASGTRRRSTDSQKDSTKASPKSNHQFRKKINGEHTVSSSWFGQKLFQSFVSPCRECHVKATMKADSMGPVNVNSH